MENPSDIDYIKNPDTWCHFGICPMVKRTPNGKEIGYLLAGKPIIYHGNIFAAAPSKDRREEFPSHEHIIAAGWEVD